MSFIAQNIEIIKKTLGLSYTKLANKISEGLNSDEKYSEDQAFNYAKGKTPPDPLFIERLSEISGIPVLSLKNDIIREEDVVRQNRGSFKLKLIKNESGTITEKLIAIDAQLRVILKRIAQIESRSPAEMRVKRTFESVDAELADLIKQEIEQLMDELRNKRFS